MATGLEEVSFHPNPEEGQDKESSNCHTVVLIMPANLENSTVDTGLEEVSFHSKVSFHSNPKEKQCQRMFKLPNTCTHLRHYQNNDQNSQIEVQQ